MPHMLPVACSHQQFSDLFEPQFVVLVESTQYKAIQIEDSNHDIVLAVLPNDKGANNFTLGFSVAGDMSGIGFHVWYQLRLTMNERACAHTTRFTRCNINELTCRFPAEWAQ